MASERKNDDEADAVILHLRQLVDSYEDLVEDMSKTLVKNQNEFDKFSRDVLDSVEINVDGRSNGSVTGCRRCTESKQIIDNLLNQVTSLAKAKKLTTSLWHSSAEQIEQLEHRLKTRLPGVATGDFTLKSSWESQQKLYQTYIARLETRLEQCGNEKNFYRRKVMESKLENEGKIKDFQIQKHKEIEIVKSTYAKEIEVVKQVLEKERHAWRNNLEKRLEDERRRWATEENERREHLKKTWRAQLDHLLAEQESLVSRETQLCEKLHETQMELLHAQQLLWCTPQVLHTSQQLETSGSKNQKDDSIKGALDEFQKEARKCEEDLERRMRCHHDECVKYSHHEKIKRENEKLGDNVYRLEKAKQLIEFDYKQNTRRLEQRIRDLEKLNGDLQAKLLQIISQKLSSSRESNFDDNPNQNPSASQLKLLHYNHHLDHSFNNINGDNSAPNLAPDSSRDNIEEDDRFPRCSLPVPPKIPPSLAADYSQKLSRRNDPLGSQHEEQHWILREQSILSKIQTRVEEDRELLISPTLGHHGENSI